MMKIRIIVCLFFISLSGFSEEEKTGTPVNSMRFDQSSEKKEDAPTIKQYPELKKFLFTPPESNFYLGGGVAPIGLVGSKFMFSVNLFQVHYMSDLWDIELFSANMGKVISNNEFADATNFSVRVAPKINIFNIFDTVKVSIGPLIGMELVKFDDVKVTIKKTVGDVTSSGGTTTITTTNDVNLTTFGIVFGAVLSETINLDSGNKLKISQLYYVQNYDLGKTRYDWEYNYQDPDVQLPENFQELKKDSVIMVEFAYLF